MTPEAMTVVENELRRFAADLKLSDEQKTKLKAALQNGAEKLEEIRKAHPDLTKADAIAKLKESRGAIRERVVNFLTPEQLTKWDAEMAKAKEFLGHKMS
jgi:protein CpxP